MKGMHQNEKGVALAVALFVLMAFSILLAAILADVEGELKMSGIERNSERALKLAETGVQVARATFMRDDLFKSMTSTMPVMQVDGFSQGGYFHAYLGTGMPGNEKWPHWHYDTGVSGNNTESELKPPLMRVWGTASRGQNGAWSGTSPANFYLNNLYGVVAGGAYFPIQKVVNGSTTTLLRAHDEYTGQQVVEVPEGTPIWVGDKAVPGTLPGTGAETVNYAASMSPMVSKTGVTENLNALTPRQQVVVTDQTIYFTYAGYGDATSGTAPVTATGSEMDQTSTVRLRAVNSLCNNTNDGTFGDTLWEYDTGIHGIGTAPVFFDPEPNVAGNEILYFAVVGSPKSDTRVASNLLDWDWAYLTPGRDFDAPEQIYVFAIIDQVTNAACASNQTPSAVDNSSNFRVKWASNSFPDQVIADSTDYPTEQVTGTNGQNPPYVRIPSDLLYALPEDDILPDYRDGAAHIASNDGVRNHVRGDMYYGLGPHAISPPVLSVMYNVGGTLTTDIDAAIAAGAHGDPIIDLYVSFATIARLTGTAPYAYENPATGQTSQALVTAAWNATLGNKKPVIMQARMFSIRDQIDSTLNAGTGTIALNLDRAKSRFPILKWNYRLPAWDPDRTDARPWNGYGDFVWDTWFEQQIAPMIAHKVVGSKLYPVLYPMYKSLGFFTGVGYANNITGPSTTQGSPVDFSTSNWDKAQLSIMAVRDTWDDYMDGLYTNTITTTNTLANISPSNPVEPFWVHDGSAEPALVYATDTTENVINYASSLAYAANANQVGFPRPYSWSEDHWTVNVFNASSNGHPNRGLDAQGWAVVPAADRSSLTSTADLDVEGETSGYCADCLDGDGLIVAVFNHDLLPESADYEDLRIHAINATTGVHVWDYHLPAKFDGDYYNGTPAIANNRVFLAYQAAQVDPNKYLRQARLVVLDGDTGARQQDLLIDDKSDAVILSPTIANGALYVGTYDFCNNTNARVTATTACITNGIQTDDWIRVFALSPMIRLLSTGIYPMTTSMSNDPSLTLESQAGKGWRMPRAERRLQVTISGGGSKWEEAREIYQ